MPKGVYERKKDELSPYWKGEKVSYYGLHNWLRRTLGNPQFCEGCKRTRPPKGLGKTRTYFHWANISGEYKRDALDYRRFCYKCHKAYDKKMRRAKGSKLFTGNLKSVKKRVNASSFIGVSRAKGGKWRAVKTFKGKSYYLGTFSTEKEAHRAFLNFKKK